MNIKNTFNYMKRLLPFLTVSIGSEVITTIILFFVCYSSLELGSDLLYSIPVWFGTTLFASLCATAVALLYFVFLPTKLHYTKFDRWCTYTIFTIYSIIHVFTISASYLFWVEEFESRFNFVAVDYLVYTQEVVGNIFDSYPMIPILAVVFALAGYFCYLSRRRLINADNPVPTFKERFCFLGIYAIVAYIIQIPDYNGLADEISSRYHTELSKSSIFCFFRAARTNELKYRDFYPTLPDAEVAERYKRISPDGDVRSKPADDELRANVIIVLMESMGSKYFSEFRNDGVKITEQLEAIASESLYFNNTYAVGTRTVRGIEAVTLGVPPLPGMALVRRDHNDHLFNIGTVFRNRGYDTKWLYGGYGYFDDMASYFEGNGYSVIDRNNCSSDEIDFATVWGICDENLFSKALKEADKTYAEGKPFMQFILTVSNHRPFTFPEGRIDLKSREAGRFGGVKYADYSVGRFIREAKQKPWYDNTIFVFVADHSSGSQGNQELNFPLHQIPLIIHGPKFVKPQKITYPISQIDTAPTLLSLMNIKEGGFIGQNALSPDYESRLFMCNYQKIAYVCKNECVIFSPVRHVSFYRDNKLIATKTARRDGSIDAPDAQLAEVYKDAIAYFQHTDGWQTFLKE